MHHLSNLPPGCTTRDIDRAAGALDEADADVSFCALGEAYCTRTDTHRHCIECGGTTHDDGECDGFRRYG